MESNLGQAELGRYEARLRERRSALRGEIRETLERAQGERFGDVAGPVPDSGDAATADLVETVNQADVGRDVDEIRDIEAALERIPAGTYGLCVDCGEPIASARLDANPVAERCTRDQELFERTHVSKRTPTL